MITSGNFHTGSQLASFPKYPKLKVPNFRIQVVVSGELDYADPFVQQQVENLTQTFENTSYISNPLYTESWLRSFVQYAERNEDYLNISIKTHDGFISALKEVVLSVIYVKW